MEARVSSNPSVDPNERLRQLHALALESSSFDELAIRIIAFRAYALSLRDAGLRPREVDALDAELVDAFASMDGNPAGLLAFLPE